MQTDNARFPAAQNNFSTFDFGKIPVNGRRVSKSVNLRTAALKNVEKSAFSRGTMHRQNVKVSSLLVSGQIEMYK